MQNHAAPPIRCKLHSQILGQSSFMALVPVRRQRRWRRRRLGRHFRRRHR